MSTLISVVDLNNGMHSERQRDTLTLNIPSDLDWVSGGVSVNADSMARYTTAGGSSIVFAATPMLLARRTPGEQCLVAADGIETTGSTCTRRYRLSLVEPRSQGAPEAG
jgi:hypothetical protein